MAVPLPMVPAMNFVEDEQWILAIYGQNEVRKIKRDKRPRSPSGCTRPSHQGQGGFDHVGHGPGPAADRGMST